MEETSPKRTSLKFRELYSNEFRLLKFYGVWIPDSTNGKYYKIYFVIINIFFCAVLNLVQILNLFHQMDDLKNFTACGYVVAIACMANVRSYYFLKNRKEFLYLIESLDDRQFSPENEEQTNMAKKSLQFYQKVKRLISTVCTISVISAMSTPVFYQKNDLRLPFASWYPFDISWFPMYQIIYIHQCIAVFYITYVNTYVDIMMAGFTTFIGIQCDLLCHTLYEVGDFHPTSGKKTLSSCIEHHKKIVNFARNTEILFNRIYLGQFIACSAALCMALFLLTLQQESNFECLYLVFYLKAIFFLLLIPCWFSSDMCRKSENIANAAYSCNWVNASKTFKRNLIFLIHRSQTPLRFYAVGLFQISVETFMAADFTFLKFLGVWIVEKNAKRQKIFGMYAFIVNIFFAAVLNLAQVINLFKQTGDLRKLASCGYVVAICCMASAKSYFIAKNRKEFQILTETLNNKIFQPKNSQQKLLAKTSLYFYRNVRIVLLLMCTTAVLSSMTTPLLHKKNYDNLPFDSWYPFDVGSSPVHELVYIHQCLSDIFISYINIYVDIIIAGFTTFIGLQCDMLCEELTNMSSFHGHNRPIKEFIEYHKHILRFASQTEKIFSEIYFLQFIASTLCLCMTLFLLSLVERNTFEFFYLIVFLASMFNLLLVPCWFSSEMKRKSENIYLAIYSCPWVDASKNVKKDIIYFMHRAQEPIQFKAIGFFNISVDTFMSIVRSSFSYYAVLNKLNMKDR